MDFQLYTDVVLLQDMPDDDLQAGDIGTVVERHDVAGLEPGYSVEFFDLLGNTVAVTTVPGSWLRLPTHQDRPMARTVPRALARAHHKTLKVQKIIIDGNAQPSNEKPLRESTHTMQMGTEKFPQ
jgi:hypothetical protein